jgi:hypothetical protein
MKPFGLTVGQYLPGISMHINASIMLQTTLVAIGKIFLQHLPK